MKILLDSKIFEIRTDNVFLNNLQDLLAALKDAEAEVIIGELSLKDLEKEDFLVTEDRDLHKDATKMELDDRVLLVEEALQIFINYINKDTKNSTTSIETRICSRFEL